MKEKLFKVIRILNDPRDNFWNSLPNINLDYLCSQCKNN